MHQLYLFPKIEKSVTNLLESSLGDLGVKDPQEIVVDIPKEKNNGDLSTNLAFRIAPVLKKPPLKIAQDLSRICLSKLKEFHLDLIIGDIQVAHPGFVNFYFQDDFYLNMLDEILKREDALGQLDLSKGKKVLLEFVSANPTGPLSIAHARQAVVGGALASILEALGFKVNREYYNNDEGNQINILGRSVQLRYQQIKGEVIDFPEDHYQGDYIVSLAQELVDKNIKYDKTEDFCEFALNKITDIIRNELNDLGVGFDVWYSQKTLRYSNKTSKVLDLLRQKGFVYDNEGAVWLKSTAFGDDKDRVLIKSDGNFTYLAPDIAYHKDKFEKGFDWLINIWGPDHHGYIPRMKAAIEALGYNRDALSVIIVQLAAIYRDGTPVVMSTRKGQYITLREVLNEVGRDAMRFFLLMRRTDSHLDFDLEVAKKQNVDNPVYYIQYAYARISSIINNAKERGFKLDTHKLNLELLKEEEERDLFRLVFQMPYVMQVCLRQLDPFALTVYLQALAAGFHRFYDKHRVLPPQQSEENLLQQDQNLILARLALIRCLQIIFSKNLSLLGISAPEKM